MQDVVFIEFGKRTAVIGLIIEPPDVRFPAVETTVTGLVVDIPVPVISLQPVFPSELAENKKKSLLPAPELEEYPQKINEVPSSITENP